MAFKCFKCGQEIVFDAMQVGKNGKKIPLDPTTELPHDCPMRESKIKATPGEGYDTAKDDHGKEELEEFNDLKIVKEVKQMAKEYVDHTAGSKGYFKAFAAPTVEELNKWANEWLDLANVRFKQWGQLQTTKDGFAIALYYEESK